MKKNPKIANFFLEYVPQQVRVVTRTALTAVGLIKSAIHHGLASLDVSAQRPPVPPTSWNVLRSPSMALRADPPLAVLDWLADLRKATFVAVIRKIIHLKCS